MMLWIKLNNKHSITSFQFPEVIQFLQKHHVSTLRTKQTEIQI